MLESIFLRVCALVMVVALAAPTAFVYARDPNLDYREIPGIKETIANTVNSYLENNHIPDVACQPTYAEYGVKLLSVDTTYKWDLTLRFSDSVEELSNESISKINSELIAELQKIHGLEPFDGEYQEWGNGDFGETYFSIYMETSLHDFTWLAFRESEDILVPECTKFKHNKTSSEAIILQPYENSYMLEKIVLLAAAGMCLLFVLCYLIFLRKVSPLVSKTKPALDTKAKK